MSPYFTAGSPETSTLVQDGMAGTRLMLSGFVVTTACVPIPGAVVDIWQADASGTYDNSGYKLRGHVHTDASGRFTPSANDDDPADVGNVHGSILARGRSHSQPAGRGIP